MVCESVVAFTCIIRVAGYREWLKLKRDFISSYETFVQPAMPGSVFSEAH